VATHCKLCQIRQVVVAEQVQKLFGAPKASYVAPIVVALASPTLSLRILKFFHIKKVLALTLLEVCNLITPKSTFLELLEN
jgi:hypothetical protein